MNVQLINSRNRTSRGHEGVVVRLKQEITELEEEVKKLREENIGLKTLETDLKDERERCIAKENAVSSLEIDVTAARLECDREKVKVRIAKEKIEEMQVNLQKKDEEIEKLKKDVASMQTQEEKMEKMRGDLMVKDGEMEELRKKIASMDELEKKIPALENDIEKYKQEIIVMDRGCRVTLERLLKEQADVLYKGYVSKNDQLRKDFAQYLKDREDMEVVEVKLFQAEEALRILENLKTEHHVPIPDFVFADLRKREAELDEEFRSMMCEDFTPADLTLRLPDEIGTFDVERIDFKAAIVTGEGSGIIKAEEEEKDAAGKESQEAMEETMDTELISQPATGEGDRPGQKNEEGEGQEQNVEVASDDPMADTKEAEAVDGQRTELVVVDVAAGVEKTYPADNRGAKDVDERQSEGTGTSTSDASIDVVN